jgi:hypothetical protein
MTKQICADCGEPMLECYTKKGLKLFVCLHNRATFVRNRVGNPKHALLYCGSGVFGLKKAFDNMTNGTRLTIKQLEKATEKKIDLANLYKSANLALELDFDAEQLPDLFSAAMFLGYSLGLDAQKSIESLVIGISRRSRLVLDNIGVVFLAEQAYRWYKESNKIDRALTEKERDNAWKEYAINQVIDKAENLVIAQ